MPRKPEHPPIVCQFFCWRLFRRDGVLYADGRTAARDLGKHSLGTRDRVEALERLRQLDHQKAIELGLAKINAETVPAVISIADGWKHYLDHCGRPQVLGGASAGTQKRYRAVQEKHAKFCARNGLLTWDQIDKSAIEKYGTWLHKKSFADRTVFLELTLLKSVVAWLVGEGHLQKSHTIVLPLTKPDGTDTYCYSQAEVTAMIDHCRNRPGLVWLANVILALACTGLRISELAGLRWTDIDQRANTIRIADERSSSRKRKLGTARTTKGRRSRCIPIHPDLAKVLLAMEKHADGRIFRGARGGILRPRNVLAMFIDEVIEPLKKRFPTTPGEIGFEHGRLHSFRHYFCSQCFLSGASEGEIKEWLGHAESKMVEHYRHLRSEDAQRKMQQIDFLGREAGDDRSSGIA